MGYTKRVNRSRSRGKGRSRRGGDGDEEMGLAYEEALSSMEKGRSHSPPTVVSPVSNPVYNSVSRPRQTKSTYNPKGDEMVGGKRRRGRKDFVTHKGDKDYNRRGHRQHKSKKSRKSLFAQLFGI